MIKDMYDFVRHTAEETYGQDLEKALARKVRKSGAGHAMAETVVRNRNRRSKTGVNKHDGDVKHGFYVQKCLELKQKASAYMAQKRSERVENMLENIETVGGGDLPEDEQEEVIQAVAAVPLPLECQV